MLDRAEIRHGDKIIKRGRPPLENPKEAVKLRLDHAATRCTGAKTRSRVRGKAQRGS
jgi:uncharacterized protein (DUF4415 family)